VAEGGSFDLLYVRNLFKPEDLGGNRYPWEVTRRLAQRGHRIRVITPRPDGEILNDLGRLELMTYPVSRRTPLETFVTNAVGSRFTSQRAISMGRPAAILVSSYDVAYAHSVGRAAMPLIFIYHSHFRSDAVRDLAGKGGVAGVIGRIGLSFIRHVERRVLASADRIVAVSPFSVREIAARVPSASSRVRLIPTGVDTKAFVPGDPVRARRALGIPAEAIVLLFVGRLVSVKRVDRAVQALGVLRERDSRYMLMVVGRGPEEAGLRAAASRAGLDEAIRFEGYQEGPALRARFDAADLQVCTSEFENWSLALLEGLASGLPIVGVPAGGIPELLGEVDKRCIAAGHEPADIARAVAALFARPGTLAEIGERGRRVAVERYDWDHVVSEIERVIAEVVQ
jgi:D-inositol-3-phosphate glycosyltransferase